MKILMTAGTALLLTTTIASAGGIERTGQLLGPLFEEGGDSGSYVQFSFGSVSPDAKADDELAFGLVALEATDPLDDFNALGFAFKTQITDQLSAALIIDEPYGVDLAYRSGPFSGLPSGDGSAFVDSEAITGVLRYKFDDNWSVHGGFRAQELGGNVTTAAGRLEADSDYDFGFVVGGAYERPDIALRVALTYNSRIDNRLEGTIDGVDIDNFTVTTPESLNLEWQTGIAKDTLLFGSVRHVRWDGFNLTADGEEFANFNGNITTYRIGVGRQLTENFSVFATYGTENDAIQPSTTPLAPTTGFDSYGVGATYKYNNFEITGGITYIDLGNQTVDIPGSGGESFEFDDNDAFAYGLRVAYNF